MNGMSQYFVFLYFLDRLHVTVIVTPWHFNWLVLFWSM